MSSAEDNQNQVAGLNGKTASGEHHLLLLIGFDSGDCHDCCALSATVCATEFEPKQNQPTPFCQFLSLPPSQTANHFRVFILFFRTDANNNEYEGTPNSPAQLATQSEEDSQQPDEHHYEAIPDPEKNR